MAKRCKNCREVLRGKNAEDVGLCLTCFAIEQSGGEHEIELRTCPACDGTGETRPDNQCRRCEGTGEIELL